MNKKRKICERSLTTNSDVTRRDVGPLGAGRLLHLADVVVGLVVGGAHRPDDGFAVLRANALRDPVLVNRTLLTESTAQEVALI